MGTYAQIFSARSKGWLIVTFALIAILVVAVNISASAAPEGTDVGGDITSNTTWTLAGSPYNVIANLRVIPNVTLTIQPGVEVRFISNTRLRVEGRLVAQGSPSSRIKFTGSTQYPGWWSGIFFRDTGGAKAGEDLLKEGAGNLLQYCTVEYAGAEAGAIRIQNSAVLVDHCTVRNNSTAGILVVTNPDLALTISFNEVYNNTYGGSGAGISAIKSTVNDNVVTNNYAGGDGGGIFVVDSILVRDNIVAHNTSVDDGGGIYSSNSSLLDNFVHGNQADEGGGVYAVSSNMTGNTIVRNHANRVAAGLFFIGSSQFTQNTVVDNTTLAGFAYGGVMLSGTPIVLNNNFYANAPFDFVVQSASDVNGANNYWGTTDTGTILGRIFDKNDDISRGLFLFQPFLLNAHFPVPPPLDLQGNLNKAEGGSSLDLSWSAIPTSSLNYTYKVHYDTDGKPPYNGTGLDQGDSPINVGSATNFSLTGMDSGLVVVVTANDGSNPDSWYSNQVDTLTRIYMPIVATSSD